MDAGKTGQIIYGHLIRVGAYALCVIAIWLMIERPRTGCKDEHAASRKLIRLRVSILAPISSWFLKLKRGFKKKQEGGE